MTGKTNLTIILAAAALLASSTAWAAGVDQKLHDMLPEKIKSAGEIKVGTEPQTPPYDFYGEDNKTIIGLERELRDEMGTRLGVKFTDVPAQFASIIPGIQAGRFDMGMSAFGDFAEREKIVDVVNYMLEGTSIIVLEGNPKGVHKLKDACGLNAGAVQGSIPLQLLDKQKTLCPADKPLNVMQFPANDQIKIALQSGRVDLSMDTTGVAAYSLQHQPEGNKKLALVSGTQYAVGYQAMLVGKESPQLRDALSATMQSMIDDGSYAKIFEKWGLGDNKLDKVTINDAARFADYMKLD
ncbi:MULTISPECIES: ABC transporter substrate-binding protein [unclassified Rhizobium]|uniref:ABC transporter substrate-binding protein n=1 Tax=unclassified Rhizobium TaxID=2613769 RepID=UPI00082856E4|nr:MULTISPECIES: ABC transporter substrate-binding protein [unclassified Rhizobium]OCI99167.1 ABC transporter substrate-binding protein [Rhizobium sp. AC27/96]TIX90638.1 ABC transporter substrate-binding protein [Rhizobium sp. P44RR-XXIV]